MKERKQEELDNYRDVAQLAVAQNATRMTRAIMNHNAKRALEMLRQDITTADDDSMADFAANMSIFAATIRNMPMGTANEALERIFNNSALITASLLGVYDLEDNSPLPTYETLVDQIKAKAAAKAKETPATPKADDDWWEKTLSRQYM